MEWILRSQVQLSWCSILFTNNHLPPSNSLWDLSVHLHTNLTPWFSVATIVTSPLDFVPADHGCVAIHWLFAFSIDSGNHSQGFQHARKELCWGAIPQPMCTSLMSCVKYQNMKESRILILFCICFLFQATPEAKKLSEVCMLAEKLSASPARHITIGAAPPQLFLIDPLALNYTITQQKGTSLLWRDWAQKGRVWISKLPKEGLHQYFANILSLFPLWQTLPCSS